MIHIQTHRWKRFLIATQVLCVVIGSLALPTAAEENFVFRVSMRSMGISYQASLTEKGDALVHISSSSPGPITYRTSVKSDDIAWFRFLLDSTDLDPSSLIKLEATCTGSTMVEVFPNGEERHTNVRRSDSVLALFRSIYKLVLQGELLASFEDERGASVHQILDSLRNKRVLQPDRFRDPLIAYLAGGGGQPGTALLALAEVTTPQQWAGVVITLLQEAGDEPYKPGSDFSPRRRYLSMLTGHPFCVDLPESHQPFLLPIYREQARIETEKNDSSTESYLRSIAYAEAWVLEK